ncbi:protein of unknown function [Candidatus Nitrospira inopinata]|uniref:Uncharacterized protein n=1 Tax=Candidatus Nitrospira inopinata TaxID=1715989 RepID=A0A0S4KLY6_9BACT|nr:protein of unknown function [Candidatus Nitrospira inopinata]
MDTGPFAMSSISIVEVATPTPAWSRSMERKSSPSKSSRSPRMKCKPWKPFSAPSPMNGSGTNGRRLTIRKSSFPTGSANRSASCPAIGSWRFRQSVAMVERRPVHFSNRQTGRVNRAREFVEFNCQAAAGLPGGGIQTSHSPLTNSVSPGASVGTHR